MILSDNEIIHLMQAGSIKVTPKVANHNVRPTGIRVHLGTEILIPVSGQLVDVTVPIDLQYNKIDLSQKEHILEPGDFVIGSTFEMFSMPDNIVGQLEGRSTIARLGMAIHCTSGIIDSMHNDHRSIILEIYNCGKFRIVLKPKIPVGMLLFCELSSDVAQTAQTQYEKQEGVTPPNLKFQPKGLGDEK